MLIAVAVIQAAVSPVLRTLRSFRNTERSRASLHKKTANLPQLDFWTELKSSTLAVHSSGHVFSRFNASLNSVDHSTIRSVSAENG